MNDKKPNYDPSIADDLGAMIRKLFQFYSLDLECAIPAVVLSYDRQKNEVTVQPALDTILTDGSTQSRAPVTVPCFNPLGTNVGINFPLIPGNTGWLIAADRDSTFFKQNKGVAVPNTLLMHRYEFGVFLPDVISGMAISPDDEGALIIETLDGANKISVKSGTVKILSEDLVQVDCLNAVVNAEKTATLTTEKAVVNASVSAEVITTTASVTATTSISVTAPNTAWTGNIALNGAFAATGAVTSESDFVYNDKPNNKQISLKSHRHTNGNQGNPTGTPIEE